jgi:hypothetical protein
LRDLNHFANQRIQNAKFKMKNDNAKIKKFDKKIKIGLRLIMDFMPTAKFSSLPTRSQKFRLPDRPDLTLVKIDSVRMQVVKNNSHPSTIGLQGLIHPKTKVEVVEA